MNFRPYMIAMASAIALTAATSANAASIVFTPSCVPNSTASNCTVNTGLTSSVSDAGSAATVTFDETDANGNSLFAPVQTSTTPTTTANQDPSVTVVVNKPNNTFTFTGDFQVVDGASQIANPTSPNTINGATDPLNDGSNYLATPYHANKTVLADVTTLKLSTAANYYGAYFGSIDPWDEISFLNGTTLVAKYSGSDLQALFGKPFYGYTSSDYVSFFDLGLYDTVVYSTDPSATNRPHYAFEQDNVTVATIPEPTSLALMACGLMLIGTFARRRA